MRSIGLALTLVLAPSMFGQAVADTRQEARFEIKHAETAQNFRQISEAIRAIAGVQLTSIDDARMSLALRGSAEQVGVAEWLRQQLDQPASRVGQSQVEYKMSGGGPAAKPPDVVLRIIRIQHQPNGFEIANAVATVGQIRVSTYDPANVLIIRAAQDDLRLPEWLIGELDQPADAQRSDNKSEHRSGPDDITAVYRLTNAKSAGDLQDIARALNTPGNRVFGYRAWAYGPAQAIIVRADARARRGISAADRIAMTDWLVKQLDRPPAQAIQRSEDYRVPPAQSPANRRSPDEFVRVYHFTAVREPMWQFRKDAEQAFRRGRVSLVDATRTVLVYGSAEELANADQVRQQIGQQP